jgi:hypothetical protein
MKLLLSAGDQILEPHSVDSVIASATGQSPYMGTELIDRELLRQVALAVTHPNIALDASANLRCAGSRNQLWQEVVAGMLCAMSAHGEFL